MPDGGNWTATMWIEYPDPQKCWHELARSSCVAYRLFVEGEGGPRVHAIANEGLNSENAEQTSAEHFLRFELPQAPHQAVRAGAGVKLGCDHRHCTAYVSLSPETLDSLVGDLC